ncbi:DUF2867 domain-containing protein [Bradyrhizobium cenepequi]|uniref:DUF2867 domain-containing protein n=1 Tax=Bradyrhizobium cenepequi TaxID=2821403 RepID=UPI001CE3922A|nr:DUF2867 domain-containing protein [Bradyrhizobium cenepequi]MCA6107659.1 DUF2867 domain-containing protein [Bradyrhizobium cenepequi]
MRAREVTPDIDPGPLLAGAEFIDAFRITVDGTTLDARRAAEKMFARRQRWIEALLRLRNLIVAPLGLKTSGEGDKASHGMVGIFPVLSETQERLVAGFNDSHLDFRVVVDVVARASGQEVTTTTLVRTHNWLGRTYLAIILPFHRLVVAAMLRQVVL